MESITTEVIKTGKRVYLKLPRAYDIMSVGKRYECSQGTQKPHEVRTRGVFYSVLVRWLNP